MHSNRKLSMKYILAIMTIFSFTQLLTACGNSEDAEKIKEALEVNKLEIAYIEISSPNTVTETTATEQFTVQAFKYDNTEVPINVSWTSSDTAIASINSSGLLTGKSDGFVIVTATFADLSASKDFQLSPAALEEITITNNNPTYSVCSQDNKLIAKGKYFEEDELRTITHLVSWASDDSSILSIDESGSFSTYKNGTVSVTAARSGIVGTSLITIEDDINSITISSTTDTVNIGSTLTFLATGTYDDTTTADITKTVTWTTDDSDILSISNATATKGIATGETEGSAVISASCDVTPTAEKSNDVTISVTEAPVVNDIAIEEDKAILEFKIAESPEQLTAKLKKSDNTYSTDVSDDDNTTWSINSTVSGTPVTISATGEITFTAVGVTEIKVRYHDSDNDIGPFTDLIEVEIVAN